MKTTTASAETTQPVADASAGVTVDAATPAATVNTASADISAQVSAAVNAENSRIMGILNCEEAKGRESQARVLAATPGMTVGNAQLILAAAPASAQVRTDTALDRLMDTAPGAVSAASQASDTDDLINTPV